MKYTANLIIAAVALAAGGCAPGPRQINEYSEALHRCTELYGSKKFDKAADCVRPFAEKGNSKAQFALGHMREMGKGVEQDYHEAAKWYEESAKQGNAHAQFRLAHLYFLGEGVAQDYVEAYILLSLAAARGWDEAEQGAIAVKRRLTAEQIRKADRETSRRQLKIDLLR